MGSFEKATVLIRETQKLSPKLVETGNYFNIIKFKISVQASPLP